MNQIRIKTDRVEILAELQDTPTSKALLDALPCESSASTWGEEVYFSVPISVDLEADARQVVEPGTVCFWVEGNAVALPYGPTPISVGDECRLISEVNVVGKVLGDPRQLDKINQADRITIEAV